jgi:putative ABC transport system substrate-binding protein
VRRSAEGHSDRIDALMREMVELDVKVIVTFGEAVLAAQHASKTIAIVGLTGDPVELGLVDSLARPGRNVTGIGDHSSDGLGKELQLLKEAAPRISRVAFIAGHPMPGATTVGRIDWAVVRTIGAGSPSSVRRNAP